MAHESDEPRIDEPHIELYWGDHTSCTSEINKRISGRMYYWKQRGLQGISDRHTTVVALNADDMKADTLRSLIEHREKRVIITTQKNPAKMAGNCLMLDSLLNATRFCMTLPDFEEVALHELRKPVPDKGSLAARKRLPPAPPKLRRQTAQDATSRKRQRAESESEEISFYESLCRQAEEQEGKRKREEESQRSDTHLECPEHTQA